jgi:hypothetical protein
MEYYRQYQNIGMHRNASPFSILKGEWKLLVNWTISKIGALTKRKGYTSILNVPDASEVLTIIPYQSGSVRRLIMVNAAGKLYSADPVTDSTWGTAILTGLDTSKRWGWTMLHDSAGASFMILGNGVTTYKTGNGTSFTTVSGAPLAPYWASFQERVYAAGVNADQDVLHWCSIGDLTNWSAVSPNDSSSLNVDKHSGGNIKNIRTLNDRVVIYKEGIIKRWDEEYLKTVMASDGLTAPWSLADIGGMGFSLDRNAIRMYDGNYPQEISSKIEDAIFGIDFSASNVERICGSVFKKNYYLSVGDLTLEDGDVITNCWIVYDYNKNIFYFFSLKERATAMTPFVNTSGVQKFYFGGTDGKVYEMFTDTETDNGEEFEAKAESHIFYPAGPELYLSPREVTVVSRYGNDIKVSLRDDYNDRPVTLSDFDRPTTKNSLKELGNNVQGMQVTVSHAGKGAPIFYGYTVAYEPEGEKTQVP